MTFCDCLMCRRLDATLDEDDTQISATSDSKVTVRPAIEDQDITGYEKNSPDVRIHINGGATLTFVNKHEGVEGRSHFVGHLNETYTTSFAQSSRARLQTAEEICSTQPSPEFKVEGAIDLELCFNGLVGCDSAGCMHDLVRLIVSFPWYCLLIGGVSFQQFVTWWSLRTTLS